MREKATKKRVVKKGDTFTVYNGGKVWGAVIIREHEYKFMDEWEIQQLVIEKLLSYDYKMDNLEAINSANDIGSLIANFLKKGKFIDINENYNKQVPLKEQLNNLVVRVDGEKDEWVFKGEVWEVIKKAFEQKDEEWKKKIKGAFPDFYKCELCDYPIPECSCASKNNLMIDILKTLNL